MNKKMTRLARGTGVVSDLEVELAIAAGAPSGDIAATLNPPSESPASRKNRRRFLESRDKRLEFGIINPEVEIRWTQRSLQRDR